VFIVQVSIVGDFSEEEIESCILDYLGTVRATRNSEREHESNPIFFGPSPSDLQFQQVRNKASLLDYLHLLMLWTL
jgi:predicted Zn-dependent peptidase